MYYIYHRIITVTSLPTYTYFIAISFLGSLLVYRTPGLYYLKLFPPFLLLTLIIEVYSSYLYEAGKSNIPIYNFFSALEFCFYLLVISIIVKRRKATLIIRYIIVLYACTATANILFIQGISTFHTITYSAGCLLVVTFCIYYFYELFRIPDSGKLEFNPAFWICTGLLFFYCCSFPLYGLILYWSSKWKLMVDSFTMIITVLNIFLYCLFTIAFLCTRVRSFTLSR